MNVINQHQKDFADFSYVANKVLIEEQDDI